MSSPLDWIPGEIDSLNRNGLYNRIRTISSPQGAWLSVDGREVLNFCSNNYLGLANHPALVEAAQRAAARYGVGPAAVRSIAGTLDLHLELERRLAAFKGARSVVTFQSGFCANLAAIPALVGAEDVIFSDELNHASIIDACRLSGAKVVRCAHADPGDMEKKLAADRAASRRALIVTDGVFSMDGDIAPLPELAALAGRFEAALMVDDAHGEGVLGRGGRGIVDHFGLHGRVDVEVGTLSKAFGTVGGLVAGEPELIDWLRQRGRPFLFSSAVTAPDAAACLAMLDLLESSAARVETLWENARFFQERLRALGFDTGRTQTPITPVMLPAPAGFPGGDADRAREFSRRLFEAGVFAMAIGYPTVAKGKARIRVMISAAHTRKDLERGLDVFEKVGREMGVV